MAAIIVELFFLSEFLGELMLNVKNIKMSAFCMVVGFASIFAPVVSTPPSSPGSDQGLSTAFSTPGSSHAITPGSSPSNKSLEAELAETKFADVNQRVENIKEKSLALCCDQNRLKDLYKQRVATLEAELSACQAELFAYKVELSVSRDRCSALYDHLASFQKLACSGKYLAKVFADNLNDLLSHCEFVLRGLGWDTRLASREPKSFFDESTKDNLEQLDKVAELEKALQKSEAERGLLLKFAQSKSTAF